MGWFDIKPVTGTVTAIMEPGHDEEVISYLVTGVGVAILVDTGMGVGDLQYEAQQLTRLPLAVVNTHAHYDHRGENFKFSQIAIHAIEAPALEQEYGNDKLRVKATPRRFTRPTPRGFSAATWTIPPSKATRILHDGDTIDLGDRVLEVLHTPGHSPGHICLLDRTERWLMTGDLYYPGNLFAHFENSDIHQMLASAQRLAALQPAIDNVLPSHNQTPMPAHELGRLADGIQQIVDGRATWEARHTEWGPVKRYPFGSFAVWTR
ncbi:MAG: MBL fold metallo-hydrolase [Chloroflexi bacterium]|nr:MBL fold metallo-hydrolase [Chloroflexota bacterium]